MNDDENRDEQQQQEEFPDEQDAQQDMALLQQSQQQRPRLPYVPTSFLAAFLLLYYALRTRQQWYLALQYLTSSKWAYLVMGNALIALCVWTFRVFTKVFLSGLRLAEAEGLGEFFRWNITETCLALTMFRTELEVSTFLVFLLLILAKCLHWVAELREQHLRMTQEAVVPFERGFLRGYPKLAAPHLLLCWLLQVLIALDILAVTTCGQLIAKHGPSVYILFAFETAILLVSATSSLLLWTLHVLDGLIHYLHDNTNSTRWVQVLHAWKDHKATLTFAVEVQAQGAKFLFYVTFFAIVMTYYGLPFNLFREVYVSFMNLKSRLLAFAKYRRLMANMNRFDPVESDEALEEAGRVCIICRDEMTVQSCKKLPGCGHVFHKSCLREWLVQQQSCPTCRADISAMDARQRQQREQEQRREEVAALRQAAAAAEQEAQPEDAQQQQQQGATSSQQAAAEESPDLVAESNDNKARASPGSSSDAPVFPSLYRVTAMNGAYVWDEEGRLLRTVPRGTVVLCTKLQWNSFNGRSGMTLRIPDGWIREAELERLMAVQLPATPARAGSSRGIQLN
jgi:E3 ubiquitin-protein ligase synoviolin